MKQVIRVLFGLTTMLILATACSAKDQQPTLGPTITSIGASATIEVTSTAGITPTAGSSTPTALSTVSATQAAPLFNESGGAYSVNLTAADFVGAVDNPYFPLPSGAKWEYEIREPDGSKQTDTIEVLADKRDVNGVQATVVRDMVSSGSQILEDTFDWFAQDKFGNVWYVGEAVDNYVAGILVNHSGSWEWGVKGAQPGIIMWADPAAHMNEKYRQEYYAGKAEDMGQVLSADESLTVPFGSFDQVVKTLDFSNIESGQEQKFYAPGIGLLKEMDVGGGEEMVLTRFTQP